MVPMHQSMFCLWSWVELGFSDVVVVLLDGLGVVCALFIGGGLVGEVGWTPALELALCHVLAQFEFCFAEAPGGLGGEDDELVEGRQFAGVLDLLSVLGDLDADAGAFVGVFKCVVSSAAEFDGLGLCVVGAAFEDGGRGEVDGLGDAAFPVDDEVEDLAVGAGEVGGYALGAIPIPAKPESARSRKQTGLPYRVARSAFFATANSQANRNDTFAICVGAPTPRSGEKPYTLTTQPQPRRWCRP
jgi:hypothetical protein